MIPLDNTRAGRSGPESVNGGLYVDKMQLLDQWLGDLFARLEELGLTENTVVVVMGDNGHFHQVLAAIRVHPADLCWRQG